MTREELEAKVGEALADHLAAEAWGALGEQKKAAAVSMAVSDIMGRVPGLAFPVPDAASSFLVLAVVEQALFLAFHYDPQAGSGSASSIVASESVDGASISYRSSSSNDDSTVSLRAGIYLKSLNRLMRGAMRVTRG